MLDVFRYEFGYNWFVAWGHLAPLALFGALWFVAWRRGWARWVVWLSGAVALWALASLVITHGVFRINLPDAPASDRFLASGAGRVLDVGAGSGRSTIGLLLARPAATAVALDIYEGNFGIADNTPERLLVNARLAGVADRVEAKTGDMRRIDFADASFDGVISTYAVDHLPRADIPTALAEIARVLKPGGEFLLAIVDVDWWARVASPHGLAHHRPPDPARWRGYLLDAGFTVSEEGRRPATLYFLASKGS